MPDGRNHGIFGRFNLDIEKFGDLLMIHLARIEGPESYRTGISGGEYESGRRVTEEIHFESDRGMPMDAEAKRAPDAKINERDTAGSMGCAHRIAFPLPLEAQ